MCDDDIHQGRTGYDAVTRRAFSATIAASAGLGAASQAVAAGAVVEKDVTIKTPDGMADAALFHPAGAGKWPAVLVWTDIFGLRPVFRDLGKRLAAQGYVVLIPNPFYRVGKAPIPDPHLDLNVPEQRAKAMDPNNRKGMDGPGIDRDSIAYLAFLDAQPQTDTRKGAGVQGYCMGGPLTFHTAAAVSHRIRGAMTCHGGGLVTANADSPHLLIPKMKAEVHCAVAQNDDARQPEAKDVLKKAFAEGKLTSDVTVYPADHGWCVPGSQPYNEAQAERAWADLSALYKRTLV